MSGFTQYSIQNSLDLEIKPIPLTTNSVLTSNTSFKNQPVNYTAPKLDENTISSIQQSLSSFLNRNTANNTALKNDLLSQQPQFNIIPNIYPNEIISQGDKEEEKTNPILIVAGVVGVILFSGIIIYAIKNKK